LNFYIIFTYKKNLLLLLINYLLYQNLKLFENGEFNHDKNSNIFSSRVGSTLTPLI